MEAIITTPELSQEEREYWNGFCTDRLVVDCRKEPRQYFNVGQQEFTQSVYYKPSVTVRNVRQRIVDHFNETFDGYVRDEKAKKPTYKPERIWSRTQNDSIESFLETIDPFQLINLPEDFTPPNLILLEHLAYRIDRVEREGRAGRRNVSVTQARIEDEEAFYQRFRAARNRLNDPIFLAGLTAKKLTMPQLAGLVEAKGRWRVNPDDIGNALTPYLRISSRYEALIGQIHERYGGYFSPISESDKEDEDDTGYYVDVSGNLEGLIDDVLPYLIVHKPQATLVKELETLQPKLDKSRNRRGDLATTLIAISGKYNLVDLLRDGFYYRLSKLNEALFKGKSLAA